MGAPVPRPLTDQGQIWQIRVGLHAKLHLHRFIMLPLRGENPKL